jgi:hypothetical protein
MTVRLRRCLALAFVLSVVPSGAHALAAPSSPPTSGAHAAPGALPASGARALARIDRATSLLRSEGLADAVRAAAALAGVRPVPARASIPAARAELARLTVGKHWGVAGLGDAVVPLLAAVDASGAQSRAALRGAPSVNLYDLSSLIVRSSTVPPGARAVARLRRMRAATHVDEPRLYGAALTLAAAIDRALPALRAIGARLPRGRAAVAGCDVLSAPPALCVSGAQPNANATEASLVIDLGGDDVHTHSAGGGTTAHPASVTIDVSGNDRYLAHKGPAQGAGNLGIGMLVDAAGDDTYAIATTDADGAVATVGQGSNYSAGAGLLADLGGNDSYSITNTKRDLTTGSGQAVGSQPGFGMLLDSGAGNDSYVVAARPSGPIELPAEVKVGGLNANGQGLAGVGGVAILSDDGGTDSTSLEDIAATVSPSETRPVTSVPVMGPIGLGAATIGGTALVRFGSGNSTHRAIGYQQAPRSGITTGNAYGVGILGGTGAFVDEGGNDTYVAEVTTRAEQRLRVPAGCACAGAHAAATESIPNVAASSLQGMGHGDSGVGIMRDLGGDDRYEASVRAIAEADVTDERADGDGAGASDANAVANAASLSVQGAAIDGVGILEDDQGDDTYVAHADSSAHASATGARAGESPRAQAQSAAVFTRAQASAESGAALLDDRGGSDVYRAESASVAAAEPGTDATAGDVFSSAQASVNQGSALLLDRDAGAPDTFALAPESPACMGTRGAGMWQDCGTGAGIGVVDDNGRRT